MHYIVSENMINIFISNKFHIFKENSKNQQSDERKNIKTDLLYL